ncbi:MAG: ABC transporter permease, partial [Anaerolineaceae bacterium]|nr:ABC transporter permease [Anaerolineaceae bacterium]
MERLVTIMKKEFFHILRDVRTLGLILFLPALLLILLGYGINFESKNTPLAVADLSKTDASRRYIQYYTASHDFELLYDVLTEDEILNLIDDDKVNVGLLIPEDFGRSVDTNKPTTVQLYINGAAEPSDVQAIQLKLNAISQTATQNILVEQIKMLPNVGQLNIPIDARFRTLYNPDGDSKLFMIPGLIPIILQVQTLLLTALAIVREREQGTMEQLIVTPIRSWELMLGKIIPYLLVSVLNMLALLWLGNLLFGVTVAGNYLELVGLSTVFIIGSLGMGVLISNLAQSQMQAIYLAVFVILIPAIILSGLMYPRSGMPLVTYIYSALLPVTHFLDITRAIMLRGVSANLLWASTLPLIILSVVYFAASVLAFRKR